jgi:hypothetical protein
VKVGRCPICHHHLDLQALAQDESARDLLALVAKTPHTVMMPLLSYLGLFRPEKRDLANDRALRLAEEALELTTDQHLLAAAIRETVEQIHRKRQAGENGQPLKNHNYLKQVMKGIADRIGQSVPQRGALQGKDDTQQRDVARADDDAAWRRQMRQLGYDPDSAAKGEVRKLNDG